MGKEEKVYGTSDLFLCGRMLEKMKKAGYPGGQRQFNIAVRARSMADANRKCASFQLGDKLFRPGWCSVTEYKAALDAVEKSESGIAICVGGLYGEYITIENLMAIEPEAEYA